METRLLSPCAGHGVKTHEMYDKLKEEFKKRRGPSGHRAASGERPADHRSSRSHDRDRDRHRGGRAREAAWALKRHGQGSRQRQRQGQVSRMQACEPLRLLLC